MNKNEIRTCMTKQMTFIGDLTEKLGIDMARNLEREPSFSWHTIANRTQMIADARRIRRELSDLIRLLQEEPK